MENTAPCNLPGSDIETLEKQRIDEEILALLLAQQVKPSDHYDRPRFTLEQNGIGFAPLGNIMAVCAEMKNGKTWLLLQLAVALLRGEFGNIRNAMPDKQRRIMWFDTEQDKYDSMLILRRIHQMCGWDYQADHPEFLLYNLRDIRYDKRRQVVMEGIRLQQPTVVFIDGIRDLVRSVNEEEECFDLINDLMSVTARQHCSIWSILHVNPNSDKMRGHLGTELGNKTTDVFSVRKKKDSGTGGFYFSVEHVAARHRDVDGWDFMIDDFPGTRLYSVPRMLTSGESGQADTNRWQELHDLMAKYVPEIKAISKSALRDTVAKREMIGHTQAWKLVDEAIRIGVIEQVIGGKYRMRGSPPDGTGEKQSELPF